MSAKTKTVKTPASTQSNGAATEKAPAKKPIIYHVPENIMKPIFAYLAERPSKETAVFVLALQQVPSTDPNVPAEE